MKDAGHTARPLRAGVAGRVAGPTLLSALCVVAVLAELLAVVALLGWHPDTSDSVLETVAESIDRLRRDGALAITVLVAALAAVALCSWGQLHALRRAACAPLPDREPARPAETARTVATRIVVANLLVLAALCVLATGRLAGAIGDTLGIGDGAVLAWDVAKWPVLMGLVVGLMAAVRRAVPMGPPVRRFVNLNQGAAAIAWCAAITGFVVYLASLDSFEEAYGSIGTGVVLIMWLTLFSVLYHATPNLRIPALAAATPAAAAAAAWLATAGVLAVWITAAGQIDAAFWALGAIAICVVGLAAANRVLLRHAPAREAGVKRSPFADRVDLVVAPSAALRNATAQGRMMSILGTHASGMSDREVDMMDWGFAYGVAWAVARGQDPGAPEEVVSERALHATQAVFQAYRGSPAPPLGHGATERNGTSNGATHGANGGPAMRV